VADRNNAGKLLSFPAPAPVPGSSAEDWSRRILEIKDNLLSALEFVRFTYDERLAGKPVRAADEILAQVVTMMKRCLRTRLWVNQDSSIDLARGETPERLRSHVPT
jgi:hypothetical protein